MFERKYEPLISRRRFILRMLRATAITGGVVSVSLLAGTVGYHVPGGLAWTDALLNAAMILTGMGPVDRMTTTAGKLFAAGYALFAGVIFLTMVALLIAPIAHRVIHRFHLEKEAEKPRR